MHGVTMKFLNIFNFAVCQMQIPIMDRNGFYWSFLTVFRLKEVHQQSSYSSRVSGSIDVNVFI